MQPAEVQLDCNDILHVERTEHPYSGFDLCSVGGVECGQPPVSGARTLPPSRRFEPRAYLIVRLGGRVRRDMRCLRTMASPFPVIANCSMNRSSEPYIRYLGDAHSWEY